MALILFLFAKAHQLGPGERWITLHPNGAGSKGTPVIVRPDQRGGYHVVGGGGKDLRLLHLTGIKSKGEDYTAEAKARLAARIEVKKRQRETDKRDGLDKAKGTAREHVKAQLREHEAKFVSTVSQALGWTEEETRFPAEKFANASEPARQKAAQNHARDLMRRAHEAVEHQRQTLVRDAEARAEAGIGEVALTDPAPDQLAADDLSPTPPPSRGMGFAPKYGERAEAAGLTEAEQKEEC